MRPKVLNQFASELLKLLTERLKRVQARQRLRNGYNFNEEQVTALISFQKGDQSKSGVATPVGIKKFSFSKYSMMRNRKLLFHFQKGYKKIKKFVDQASTWFNLL
jgi:hypothetical protein